MKMQQISEHIWSLRMWLLIPIHVWIVLDEKEGVTLVDAGMPMMAKGILTFIDQLGSGPLQRVLLTHGHSDHVGAIKRIVQSNPVPVYAHRIELPYMEGKLPYPRRKQSTATVDHGVVQALPEDEQGAMLRIGGLMPHLTPGHSPGHITYYHERDQVLLAGDLFTSRKGKLRKPMSMFTGDMAEAVRSSAILGRLQPQRLEICHGSAVLQPADQLQHYIAKSGISL